MKKLVALLLVGALSLSMLACGNKEPGDGKPAEGENITESTEESAVENTETNYGVGVTLAEVKTALTDALGEDYWPQAEVPADMLGTLYGITEDMYEEYLAETPMISVNVDTLIIIKAKEDKVADVEAALTAYRETLVNDTMQYPMNVGKIQASRIATFGQYVCFVQLGADTTAESENGEEAVIEKCQQANEMALEIIENTLAKNQ